MNKTDWEQFETINKCFNFVSENTLNDLQLSGFNISRNNKLELIGKFVYTDNINKLHNYKRKERTDNIAGTVKINNSAIKLISKQFKDSTTTISGLSPEYSKIGNLHLEQSSLEEHYSIDSIRIEGLQQGEAYVTIEWVCNMDLNPYTWPNGKTTDNSENNSVTFHGNDHSLTIKNENLNQNVSMDCCHINVQGFNIYFGIHRTSDLDKNNNPGYIIYEGEPDEVLKSRIRSAISFITGNNLLYLGSEVRNSQMQTLRADYKTPNLMGGLFQENKQSNPLALMKTESRVYFSDNMVINNIINNFVESFDKYDLNHILWLYWHATIAPAHLRAVCFGATLEFTQKNYFDVNSISFKGNFMKKDIWRKISKSLLKVIADSDDISVDERKIIENKIGNINNAPQSILTERFFSSLALNLGEKETAAYSRRNDAAHGNKTPNDDYISLIRDSKILHILCNRVLIKILSLSDNYIDFYTIGHPIRNISEQIPD